MFCLRARPVISSSRPLLHRGPHKQVVDRQCTQPARYTSLTAPPRSSSLLKVTLGLMLLLSGAWQLSCSADAASASSSKAKKPSTDQLLAERPSVGWSGVTLPEAWEQLLGNLPMRTLNNSEHMKAVQEMDKEHGILMQDSISASESTSLKFAWLAFLLRMPSEQSQAEGAATALVLAAVMDAYKLAKEGRALAREPKTWVNAQRRKEWETDTKALIATYKVAVWADSCLDSDGHISLVEIGDLLIQLYLRQVPDF